MRTAKRGSFASAVTSNDRSRIGLPALMRPQTRRPERGVPAEAMEASVWPAWREAKMTV